MSGFTVHVVTEANASLLERVAPDVFDGPLQPELVEAFLARHDHLLVVAVAEGVVVGMASGVTHLHPDKPLQLFMNEVGVAEAMRRRGVASALCRALLERSRELGCGEAWVATEAGNVAARALYAALGGVEDEDHAVVYEFGGTPER
jgi:ribosomal protein S18 acetylase RimI-like enzyme